MKPAYESEIPTSGSRASSARASLADMRFADALTALAVERLQSMSKAAREIGVTPSQVSKTIARLQAWMGGPLFERTGNDVVPTALGRRFLERVRPVADTLRDLAGEAEAIDSLRVNASELAFMLVVDALTRATAGRFSVEIG